MDLLYITTIMGGVDEPGTDVVARVRPARIDRPTGRPRRRDESRDRKTASRRFGVLAGAGELVDCDANGLVVGEGDLEFAFAADCSEVSGEGGDTISERQTNQSTVVRVSELPDYCPNQVTLTPRPRSGVAGVGRAVSRPGVSVRRPHVLA